MAKKCSDCDGRGRWQDRKFFADGSSQLQWYDCTTCKGTGVSQDPNDSEPFDFGGEDDDDD